MSATEAVNTDQTHDDHHDHPEWLAHHFDDAEQQFDSGKLGMWLFLVTEVLFFSGMFCAYAYLRSRDPNTFAFASQFLNSKLGAINTGVLLFSSLTMAWAVRASQLSQHKLLVGLLGATLSCASMFLGVKAVEYSHKWGLGLLPGKMYVPQEIHYHSDQPYLLYICIVPVLLLAVFAVWYVLSIVKNDAFQKEVSGPITLAAVLFFAGVGLGTVLESGEEKGHTQVAHHEGDEEHSGEHHDDHPESAGDSHENDDDHEHADDEHAVASDQAGASVADSDNANSTETQQYGFSPAQSHEQEVALSETDNIPDVEVNQAGKAGLFFGIYYCMTGIHAIHILAGMLVICWLIVKAAKSEFHSKYYGPVDNVGLYWHLVDFIWIYLFPLLYLIG